MQLTVDASLLTAEVRIPVTGVLGRPLLNLLETTPDTRIKPPVLDFPLTKTAGVIGSRAKHDRNRFLSTPRQVPLHPYRSAFWSPFPRAYAICMPQLIYRGIAVKTRVRALGNLRVH